MKQGWRAVCMLAVLSLVLACGSSKTTAPAAPSATTSTVSSPDLDLSVITPGGTLGAGVQAPVIGVVAQVSGICPELTFVLSGVTIHVGGATRFEAGACQDVKEGMRAGAIGTLRADGSIDAQRVKVGSPPPPAVTGQVMSLSGACPALTFVLEGVTVRTSSITVFEGGTCLDLRVGMRAGAIGPKGADGSIAAEHVKMAAEPPTPVTGVIRLLAGTCPAVTFVIENVTVRTNSNTVFEGGACGDLGEGVRAGAIGPKAGDGSINAERIKIAPVPLPAVTGAIVSVTGTCPELTFVIGQTTVHTSAKTVFDGCTCADVRAGAKGGAIGPKRADGSIDAEKVRVATK